MLYIDSKFFKNLNVFSFINIRNNNNASYNIKKWYKKLLNLNT